MAVTATNNPNLLRVSFMLSQEAGKGVTTYHETEVVCFLQIIPGSPGHNPGWRVVYSHHTVRTREAAIGPFTSETYTRHPLNAALRATIEHCVKEEVWACFNQSCVSLDDGIVIEGLVEEVTR